jgi:hypothetical protein
MNSSIKEIEETTKMKSVYLLLHLCVEHNDTETQAAN